MTANEATMRQTPRLRRMSIAVARWTHRRDEIEAIGLVLGIFSILLAVVAVGVPPGL